MKKISIITSVVVAFLIFAIGCEKQYEGYQRGTAKARQIEAKLNLNMLVIAQTGFYAMSKRYGRTFDEIGFSVQGENQVYTYYLGDDVLEGVLGPDEFPEFLAPSKVTDDSFVVYAIANLDTDPDLDVWRIDHKRNARHLRDDR